MNMSLPSAGRMKYRLRFERRGTGSGVAGNIRGPYAVLDGSPVNGFSASVEPTSTRNGADVLAGRMSGKVQYDIWVRSCALLRGLRQGDRAVNIRTGEVYTLGQPIDPTGRRQWLFFQSVSAGNANGQG